MLSSFLLKLKDTKKRCTGSNTVADQESHTGRNNNSNNTHAIMTDLETLPISSELGNNLERIKTESLTALNLESYEYSFETDHLALKGNKDYECLLRTVAILQAQKAKAIQDLDRLIEARDEALANPVLFVEKLQRKEDLQLPKPQTIANIPHIEWEKYTTNPKLLNVSRHHMTRRNKLFMDIGLGTNIKTESKKQENIETDYDLSQNNTVLVRGRAFGENKSQTFNQLWTIEEQKKLEDLLIKFPPEEVEARRWAKIAKALGNRTTQQVASRVQKYFIKLTKAGLPVPGRIPNLSSYSRKGSHRHQRNNRFLFQPSTFFTSHEPPVFMSENDDEHTGSGYSFSVGSSINGDYLKQDISSDEEEFSMELQETQEYKELLYWKKMYKQSIGSNQCKSFMQHIGYKCDRCECEPIVGTRWHCVECIIKSVDLCDECVDCMFETEFHLSSHRLEPFQESTNNYVDRDYTQFLPGDYNYLDPNYMPAM